VFLFTANCFALTKPASVGWQNVGTSLKIPPVEQIIINSELPGLG